MNYFYKVIIILTLLAFDSSVFAQSDGEAENRFAFVEILRNEKLISEKVYESVIKRPHLFALGDSHFYFLKSLEKVFIENDPDYAMYYPGVREQAGLYWIKYKGNPPKSKTFDPIPSKPAALSKHKAAINKLQSIFLKEGIISQKVHNKLAQLIQYNLILHPKYYIHAVVSGNLYEDLNSSASLETVVMAYKDAYARKKYLETLEKAKSGSLNYARLIKSISIFKDFGSYKPKSAEDVVYATRDQLSNVTLKVKIDSFIIKKDTIDYGGELILEDQLFLKVKYKGQRFELEYPLDVEANNPYSNFDKFVQSEGFTYLLNTIVCDETGWGRVIVVNTRGVIDELLERYHFEPFNEKFYTLREGENAFGFMYITMKQYAALYESGFDARTDKDIGVSSLFNFPMDGLVPYISFTKKIEMLQQLDSIGFFNKLNSTEYGQTKSQFLLTPLSDPAQFILNLGMVYEPLFDCVSVVEVASGEHGDPHREMFSRLKELSGGDFDPTDFSSVRDSQQVTDILFKLNDQSFEYPLVNFYRTNSMCRNIVNIAADAFNKVEVSDKNFYYPVGYGSGSSPKYVFYITAAESEIFKTTFQMPMRPFGIKK
jgi:hypothetical protein